MSQPLFVLFRVLLSVESFVICIGNAFAVSVFWQKRLTLQRTSYLWINLAVSDLLVGLWELILVAARQVPFLFGVDFNTISLRNFMASLTILFSCSSSFTSLE